MFQRPILACRVARSRVYSTRQNQAIIDLLQRCLKEEDSSPTRNQYKVRSFQVALAAIYEHDKPIRSGQEASQLRGIGLGIANRIDFFLQGKDYDEASAKQIKARLLAVEELQKIPGIGVRTATNLVNAGAASVSDLDLPKYTKLLSPSQKVSVQFRDHLTRPVSRSAAEDVAAFIRDHISTNFEVHLTGAYRRDAPDLPEITILLHHRQHIHVPLPRPPAPPSDTPRVRTRGKPPMPFFQDVIRPLEASALLATATSSLPYRWRGIALLPLRNGEQQQWQDVGDRLRDLRAVRGTYVRLDISLAPLKSRGAAQIALTGDDEFVRAARLAAVRNGLHLDEYGLWRWRESESDEHGYWELVQGENETQILDEIGLGNVLPCRRNFRFLVGLKRASARNGTLDVGAAGADLFVMKRGKPPRPRNNTTPAESVDHSGEGEGGVVVGAPPEDVDEV